MRGKRMKSLGGFRCECCGIVPYSSRASDKIEVQREIEEQLSGGEPG